MIGTVTASRSSVTIAPLPNSVITSYSIHYTKLYDTIADIPQAIKGAPDLLEVRGEVYMEKAAFANMNAGLEAEGKQTYVNPRNSAAGALRQLDPRITSYNFV